MTSENRKTKRPSRGFIFTLLLTVAVAAAAFWYAAHLRVRAEAEEDGSYIPKSVAQTEEISLLQRYVRIDTQNPPGNETRGAEFLRSYLAQQGIAAEIIEPRPGRGSVYARIAGESRDGALLLLHHIDVAPVNERQWTEPAFSGSLRRNILWGRGSLDMKGIGVTHLSAFVKAAKRGRKPKHDIIFLGVADEEAGGELGMGWIVRNRPDVVAGVRYVFNEGGITEVVRDKLTHFSVEVGAKQFVKVRVEAREKSVLQRVRFELAPYFEPTRPLRIIEGVNEFFTSVAPKRRAGGELLRDVRVTISAGKFWVIDPAHRALLTNYIHMGGIAREGEVFVAMVTLSDLPGEDAEKRIAWLRSIVEPLGAKVEVSRILASAAFSSTKTSMFTLIREAVKRQHGASAAVGPAVSVFVTNDCRFLRSESVDCYGFSPYLVDFFHSKGIHSTNEQLRLDWFVQGVELMNGLVERYAFGV